MAEHQKNQKSGESSPVAFSEEALAEYQEILGHYPERRAALMSVLWLAQREFGWLSPEAQSYVAGLMELPLSWVEGVATFYTMYHKVPVGNHHLQVCTNLSCYLRGSDELMGAIRNRLKIEPGEVSGDGKFSLERVECLGSCGSAPVMQLSNDRYFEDLDADQLLALIDSLEKGEEV